MKNYQFERAAKNRSRKALLWAIIFHVAILGTLALSSGSLDKYLPDILKEWMSKDTPSPDVAETPIP
ncbi:MAG: hypothetical protein GY705_07435 [Bacteroidetes bacterium]|nr:hypothetical protein [Bacteroidota bacterium]